MLYYYHTHISDSGDCESQDMIWSPGSEHLMMELGVGALASTSSVCSKTVLNTSCNSPDSFCVWRARLGE